MEAERVAAGGGSRLSVWPIHRFAAGDTFGKPDVAKTNGMREGSMHFCHTARSRFDTHGDGVRGEATRSERHIGK